MIAANLFVGKPWGMAASTTVGAFAVGLLALFGLADMAGVPLLATGLGAQARFALDAGLVVTAAAAAGFLIPPIRRDVAAVIPIDPANPVHLLALVMATMLLGMQVTAIAFTDVLASNTSQPPLTVVDLLENELPFLLAAVVGVGIFMRRTVPETATRLGLVRPAWWHIALALAGAGAFYALGAASDNLSHAWTPDLARRVDETTQHVFGQLNTPLGIAAIALIPGICEEILFRGALQPRLGLIFTAILFTSVHTEYGLSFDTATVLVIAIGLGLMRKYTNTTTSLVCHVGYNLLVAIGIGGSLLNAAVVAEVALILVVAYAIWTLRHRALTTSVGGGNSQV